MLYYLNNWRNIDHASLYGADSFYDLWDYGIEGKRARQLVPGDTCLVLSRGQIGQVCLTTYEFAKVEWVSGTEANKGIYVLKGAFKHRDMLPKTDAAKNARYARFFNKLGHVNQWSILEGAYAT